MQGHLGGHWFPSIGFNHPFQFLGTITFKFLLEPSLSDWVRTEKSGEERIWLMESQGPQHHWRRQHQGWGQREGGGGRSGGEQQQYCSGAAMGSAPDLVVYGYFLFWLWSFVVFKLFGLKFLLVLFWTWSMCFFFYRVYLLDFPWRSLSIDIDSSTSDSLERCFWVRPLGTLCQILGLHSVPFSYSLSFRWTQSTFLIFLANNAWIFMDIHGWIVMSFVCTGSVMRIYCFIGRPITLASWSQISVPCLKLVATCVIFCFFVLCVCFFSKSMWICIWGTMIIYSMTFLFEKCLFLIFFDAVCL